MPMKMMKIMMKNMKHPTNRYERRKIKKVKEFVRKKALPEPVEAAKEPSDEFTIRTYNTLLDQRSVD